MCPQGPIDARSVDIGSRFGPPSTCLRARSAQTARGTPRAEAIVSMIRIPTGSPLAVSIAGSGAELGSEEAVWL
jgi:hypothetical protein